MQNQTAAPPAPRSEGEAIRMLNRIPFSSYDTVANAVANDTDVMVTLVRGASTQTGQAAATNSSAGGETPNPSCGRPTETNANSQVGGSQPGIPQSKLPEFTCDPALSVKWARRGGWLMVRINTKYLVKGDVGQQGWVCLHSAPVEAVFIPHPQPVAMNIPNAD